MIDVEVKVKGRGITQTGATNFSFNTAKEIEQWVISNHIVVSKEILTDFQNRDEFPKREYITLTDGVIDLPETNVKAFGKIEYATKLQDITPVVLAAMRLVTERSPTSTGYYQANNVLFFNGNIVAKGLFQVNSWLAKDRQYKNTDTFRVVNLSPYARKLERNGIRRGSSGRRNGITYGQRKEGLNRKKKKTLLPNGAYLLSSRVLKSRFPQLKNNIRFSFIPLAPSIARQAPLHGRDTTGHVFRGDGRPYLYPSIYISIRAESFTLNSGFTEQAGNLWVVNL